MLRFAPSPTSDMDISNLRVAILNYIVAKQKNEKFLVRIADTDKIKNIEGKDTEIMMILEKFAIGHDLVYHQSQHLNIHQQLALRLLKEKKSKNFDSSIIMNSDNTLTENFASACDDMLSEINFIICEETELINTEKQIYIKSSLGYTEPTEYIYIPTIENKITIKELFEQGFIPDAILNYLILLDNPKAPKEIFTLPEAIEWFDLNNISKESVKFDINKLRFINHEHIKMMDDKELSKLFGFADSDIGKLAKLYLGECATINELEGKIRYIFTPKDFDKEWGEQMRVIEKIIFNAPYFEEFDEFKKYIAKESGLKGDNLLKPLRVLLTGDEKSKPKLSEIYPLVKSYILEVAS
ncbi:MAG TPA: glutamate--tRNA ligase [Campylobacterales bacterium]|nr:glutamate--tRNA ligase [Campylobacterales bacterium]